jgi:hypothetical protein
MQHSESNVVTHLESFFSSESDEVKKDAIDLLSRFSVNAAIASKIVCHPQSVHFVNLFATSSGNIMMHSPVCKKFSNLSAYL